jgi:hypothetical protein
MNIIEPEILEQLFDQVDFDSTKTNPELLADNDINSDLKNYLILTHWPEKLVEKDSATLYYNRYEYFLRFKKSYITKFGSDDLNLEQQAFKILEQGETIANLDWNVVETISRRLE